MKPCSPDTKMEMFARSQLGALIDTFSEALSAAAETPDEEAVHKLRVSIRRLQQGLRTFQQYVSRKQARQVRARLKSIMDPAGEVRNFDIARGLIKKVDPEFNARQDAARAAFRENLQSVVRPDLAVAWRAVLGVDGI